MDARKPLGALRIAMDLEEATVARLTMVPKHNTPRLVAKLIVTPTPFSKLRHVLARQKKQFLMILQCM